MDSKGVLLLGLLIVVVFVISSHVVSAGNEPIATGISASRSGYNNVQDGRSGYNNVQDGCSGYNSVQDDRSGYNNVQDGCSGYNHRAGHGGHGGHHGHRSPGKDKCHGPHCRKELKVGGVQDGHHEGHYHGHYHGHGGYSGHHCYGPHCH